MERDGDADVVVAVGVKVVQRDALPGMVPELTAWRSYPHGPAADASPDIYIILLDGYLRPDKLKAINGFDDAPFVRELQDRSFAVASRSRSNYLETTLTLASMLNMQHLDAFPEMKNYPWSSREWYVRLLDIINDNVVFRLFRDHGYSITSVGPGWGHVELRSADRFVDTGEVDEFEQAAASVTLVEPIVDAIDPAFFGDQQRERVTSALAEAPAIAAEPASGPKFVFIHVPSPHPPHSLRTERGSNGGTVAGGVLQRKGGGG